MGRNSSGKYPNGMKRRTLNLDKKFSDILDEIAEKCEMNISNVILYYISEMGLDDCKEIKKWALRG